MPQRPIDLTYVIPAGAELLHDHDGNIYGYLVRNDDGTANLTFISSYGEKVDNNGDPISGY